MTVFIDVFVNGNSCLSLFCLADFCTQLHRQVYWEFVESNRLWLLFKSFLHLGQSTGAVGCQFLSYPLSDESTLTPQRNSMSVSCPQRLALRAPGLYPHAVLLNERGLSLDGTWSSCCEWRAGNGRELQADLFMKLLLVSRCQERWLPATNFRTRIAVCAVFLV